MRDQWWRKRIGSTAQEKLLRQGVGENKGKMGVGGKKRKEKERGGCRFEPQWGPKERLPIGVGEIGGKLKKLAYRKGTAGQKNRGASMGEYH